MPVVFHVQNDILWLEVSIDNLMGVQVLQRHEYLTAVELHVLLYLRIVLSDLRKKRAPFDIFNLEIKILSILERTEKLD